MPRGKNITDIILTWCCTSEFAGQFKVIGSHSSSMDLKKKKKKKMLSLMKKAHAL